MNDEQTHPLYIHDRKILDSLLPLQEPTDESLVELARLIIRYEAFPGAEDIKSDLQKLMTLWNLNREKLFARTRLIWLNGFRSNSSPLEDVGSGFDTSDEKDG